MDVYAYCRVSKSDSTDDTSQSIETQQAAIRAWALSNDADVVQWFIDDGVSGGKALSMREGGAAMLAALRRGDVSTVVCHKGDRMFRDAADALVTRKDMAALGVDLLFLDGANDSKLMFGIMATVAEFERDRIRERIKDNKTRRRDQGKTYAVPRFGYRNEDGRVVPDEAEQKVIAWMRIKREKDWNFRQIADELNARNIPTKREGKQWYKNTVRRILLRSQEDAHE